MYDHITILDLVLVRSGRRFIDQIISKQSLMQNKNKYLLMDTKLNIICIGRQPFSHSALKKA